MLKKTERLDRSSFSNYFKKGKRINGTYATIINYPAPTLFGSVVVGKKVSKSAVKRNSIRRRIYGILDILRVEKELKGVYIIIAKPEVSKLSKKLFTENMTKEIGRALN